MPGKKAQNAGFTCIHCGQEVLPLKNGSYRNHCPACFYSLHVDDAPGDRASDCGGAMRPAELIYHSKKGYQLVHICEKCGHRSVNRLAQDDPRQRDDVLRLTALLRG